MNWYSNGAEFDGASISTDNSAALVRVDVLRKFDDLARTLGGDPDALLTRAQIDPAVLFSRTAVVSYRAVVQLLERAAIEFDCPDFGMRLAKLQGGAKVLGPIAVAMKNSHTMGEAFRYCAEHVHAYSAAAQIGFEPLPDEQRSFMRFEILLSRLPYQRQVTEQALLLTHHAAMELSDGFVRAREVWFSHDPLAPLSVYRAHFGCPIRFGQSSSGLIFTDRDLQHAIVDPDPQLYELATSFIDSRFPAADLAMSTRVRALVARQLDAGDCTNERIASLLGLRPRTLQRRLRDEGQSFETIKDEVRRDVALRCLGQSKMPLMRVAERLGYSEGAVLSRSCYRWFSATPRQLRSELTRAPAGS